MSDNKQSPEQDSVQPKISGNKKLVFTGILILTPIVLFLILEMALRIFDYGDDLRLFVSSPDESSEYYGMNLDIGRRYYTYLSDTFDPKPRKDLFLKEKPEDCFRVFVMGASTTAGFPYGNNVSFSRFLHQRLLETFPGRHIEVVNTALTSINSYSLVDFTNEILDQRPDAILIYAGHNEYYGPFGPVSGISLSEYPNVVKIVLWLQRFKSFVLLRDILGSQIRSWTNQIAAQGATTESGKVSHDFIERSKIPMDSELYKRGLVQFESNMREIVERVTDAGVPVLLSELISNVRDLEPFPTLPGDSLSKARVVFKKARALEAEEKYDDARMAYYAAKDFDPVRFRAPEDFNKILHKLGNEFKVPVVPMRSYFETVSPNGLIGNNVMLEHVHPDVKGYFLMADAFYDGLRRAQLISKTWPDIPNEVSVSTLINWGFTRLDSLNASLVLLNLKSGWPFNTETFSTIRASRVVIDQFPVRTKEDSIALATYTEPGYSLQVAHLDLAEYYESIGDTMRALAEYRALIYSFPMLDMFYEDAVRILMDAKKYHEAQKLLRTGLGYNRSAFMYKWLGQTCLVLNRLKDGLGYLEKAYAKNSKDEQLNQNLVRAYFNIFDFEKGDEVLKNYEKIAKDENEIKTLQHYGLSLRKKASEVKTLTNIAQKHLEDEDYRKAISALQKSVKIQETATANELMGVIMLKGNKYRHAVTYLERARNMDSTERPSLLYNLTVAYLESGQTPNAMYTLGQLRKLFPDFTEIEKLEGMANGTVVKEQGL